MILCLAQQVAIFLGRCAVSRDQAALTHIRFSLFFFFLYARMGLLLSLSLGLPPPAPFHQERSFARVFAECESYTGIRCRFLNLLPFFLHRCTWKFAVILIFFEPVSQITVSSFCSLVLRHLSAGIDGLDFLLLSVRNAPYVFLPLLIHAGPSFDPHEPSASSPAEFKLPKPSFPNGPPTPINSHHTMPSVAFHFDASCRISVQMEEFYELPLPICSLSRRCRDLSSFHIQSKSLGITELKRP